MAALSAEKNSFYKKKPGTIKIKCKYQKDLFDPILLSKYFVVNNNALLCQHQNICNDMNIMAQ